MELHTLPSVVQRNKKRLGLGHGSGRGKTGGRGTKGQKARNSVPLRFEGGALPLVKRMPFLRGKLRNKARGLKPYVLNLHDLARIPAKGTVDVDTLIKMKIVEENARKVGVKLLGHGTVNNPLTVKVPVSQSAADKIIKAGGSIENKV